MNYCSCNDDIQMKSQETSNHLILHVAINIGTLPGSTIHVQR